MALVLKDRVKVLATTTGTGTFTLGAAVAGFQDFSVIGNGNTTYYTIVAQATPDWEVGIGTYTASGTLLSRDTILESSNAGAAVDFPAGTKDVFVTYPAERATYLDTAGAYPVQNTFNTLNAANAVLTAGTVSTTPLADTDIANKIYVDNLVSSGIHFHAPVRVESPIALTVTYNNGASGVGATLTNAGTQVALVIDGVTVSVSDRVLIYTQADATQNGVYVVTSVGSGSTNWVLTRSDDTDSFGLTSPNTLGEGSTFFVQQGTTGAGETYTCNTVGTITFGTTNITFAQISSAQIYSAGTGLTLSGTQFSLSNTGTAGTYGSASNVPVFTTNAQGQVTAVTDTAIAIAAGAVSGLAASATTDTTNASNITTGTLPTGRLTGSYTGVTGVGTLTAGTWNGSTIAAAYGGTGLSTFVAGDIIYADSSTTLARLADTAVGNALISGGAAADPSWGKIGLATHVDGTLPIANGGTNGAATPTAGGVAYGNGTAYAFSSAGTSGQVLTSSGTGAPSWTTLSSGTVTSVTGTLPISVATGTTTPVISISQAATASDGYLSSTDWNTFNNKTSNTGTVTSVGGTGTVNGITLTGTVTTSGNLTLGGTLSGVSLTTQVSGTLPIANGGTNATTAAAARTNLDVPTRTGGDASGTWGISITGNAATATALQTARTIGGVSFNGTANINLPGVNTAGNQNTTGSAATLTSGQSNWSGTGVISNVVGMLAWKNYGNSHVIFDASNSTTPSGTACSNTDSGSAWTGTYPTLMGWNGSTTYGVRVDRARLADVIVSQANSATITASTGVNGNQIVQRDGSGYIYANHINFNTGEAENPSISSFITSNGDGWSRKSSKAHVVSQLEAVSKLGTSYYQVNTWLQLTGAHGLYAPSVNGAHLYPNNVSGYGEWATQGSRSGYSGIQSTHSGVNGIMFDGAGNGGAYREASSRWYYYYNVGNDCMGIGTSSTSSDYSLYISKGVRAFTTIYTQGAVYGQNFYSWNDASYYLTPAGTSRLNNIVMVATNGSGNWPLRIDHPDRGIIFYNASGSAIPLYFLVNGGGTLSGYVVTSGATTQYITTSDYRMKENVQDLDKLKALNKIMSVKPREFNWLEAHGGKADFGFIAHELQEVAPECVAGTKDAMMPDGKIMPQGVDTSFLIPTLCAAIQKQQEMIEQLMAEVALLKGI